MDESFGQGVSKSSPGSASAGVPRDEGNQFRSPANELQGESSNARVNGSMRKVSLVCSLLLAFSASMFGILGCDAGAKPGMSGPAPKGTAPTPKPSGAGSTTGPAGVEVPAAPGGAQEEPAEKPAEKTEEKPAEAKPEADAKPEEKKPE